LKFTLLGGLSPARFLRRHWQKKALLVRGAFPGFKDPVSPEELAGLACEAEVESRLVLERGARRPWRVRAGPQTPSRLRRLPRTHWTLLVQGVDRVVPGVAALTLPFRFVPEWRIDDVMVSFAPRFGSVGPHVDSYDVFLLQGQGRRRWAIDTRATPEFRPGLDLRILRRFRPEATWVLEPGDMLYLPPGVAHHGVALEDCLTYSIGFRAPSGRELLAAALRPGLAHGEVSPLYGDPHLRPARHPGELSARALRDLRRLVENEWKGLAGPEFAAAVGAMLTEPKSGVSPLHPLDPKQVAQRLRQGASLVRVPGARLAFTCDRGHGLLFAEGHVFALPPPLAFAGPLLTGSVMLHACDLIPHLRKPGFAPLLANLLGARAWDYSRAR
jgi:50S ribosomal protein L16 3-hydroxylase